MFKSRDHRVAMTKPVLLLIFTTSMFTSVSSSAQLHDQRGSKCSNGSSIQHGTEIANTRHHIGDLCDVQDSDLPGHWMIIDTGEVDCRHCCAGFHWDKGRQSCVKCPKGTTSKAGPFLHCTHIDPSESISTQSPHVSSTRSPLSVNASPTPVHNTDSRTQSFQFPTSVKMRHSKRPDTVSLSGKNVAIIIGSVVPLAIIIIVILKVFKKCILIYLRKSKDRATACFYKSIHISHSSRQPDISPDRGDPPETQPLNSPSFGGTNEEL